MRTKEELLEAMGNCKQGEAIQLSIDEVKFLAQEGLFTEGIPGDLLDLFEKDGISVSGGLKCIELRKEDDDLNPNRVLH